MPNTKYQNLLKQARSERGLTLIEVIVSIALITMVGIALSSLARYVILSGTISESRTKAYNLVQKTIEVIHNIRDTNWAEGKAWDTDLTESKILSKVGADPMTGEIQIDGGKYKISVTSKNLADNPQTQPDESKLQKKFIVLVTWESRKGIINVKAETYISDWKPIL